MLGEVEGLPFAQWKTLSKDFTQFTTSTFLSHYVEKLRLGPLTDSIFGCVEDYLTSLGVQGDVPFCLNCGNIGEEGQGTKSDDNGGGRRYYVTDLGNGLGNLNPVESPGQVDGNELETDDNTADGAGESSDQLGINLQMHLNT